MKTVTKITICLMFVLLFTSLVQAEDFQSFYSRFRSVVIKKDKNGLKNMMSSNFDWALDGYVSRNEAFSNIGSIIGWKEFWTSAKKAVAKKPKSCNPVLMNEHSGFCTFSGRVAFLFEQGSNGNWYWSGLPGD